jgi:phytoene desaturase
MIASAPALMKLQAWRSVYDKVAGFVKDEHVRQALSFHSLLVGGSPFATSSIYALIHALERRGGVWFPRGGTHALIRALVKLFQGPGRTIHLSTRRSRRSDQGRPRHRRDRWPTASSRPSTWSPPTPTSCTPIATCWRTPSAAAKVGKALEAKRWSPSLFVVYFGLKTTHPEIRHHTICFGARYRELIGEIYGKDGLADDFSLYLHHPTASDPSWRPRAARAFYALSPVPNLKTADIDWSVEGPKYRDKILAYLRKALHPGPDA